MTATLAKPVLVDVTVTGTGPFAVIEFGPRALHAVSSFAVVRVDDPGKWPWFCATNRGWCVAVAAALNGVAK